MLVSLALLWVGVGHLRDQEFVGAILLVTAALSVLRAGVDLLRQSMGE